MIKVWPNIFNKTEPTRTWREGNKDSRSGIQNNIYTLPRLFQGQLPSAKEDLADTTVAHGVRIDPTNTLIWWRHSPCSTSRTSQTLWTIPTSALCKCWCLKPREGQKDCSTCRLGRQERLRPDLLFFSCLSVKDAKGTIGTICLGSKDTMKYRCYALCWDPDFKKHNDILRRQTAACWQFILRAQVGDRAWTTRRTWQNL